MKRTTTRIFLALMLLLSFLLPVQAVNDKDAALAKIRNELLQESEEIDVSEFYITEEEADVLFIEAMYLAGNPSYLLPNVGYSIEYDGYISDLYPYYLDERYDRELYEQTVQRILDLTVHEGMSDLQIALSVHDYLASHFQYDETYTKYTGYDLLVNAAAVCQGYATAYMDLLQRAGIQTCYVRSTPMNHAWCLVQLDGSWYHVDLTWDDPVPDTPGYVDHMFFLLSDEFNIYNGFAPRHYDWITPFSATDTQYEKDMFWSGLTSPVVYLDSDRCVYLRIEDTKRNIYLRQESTGTETLLTSVDAGYVDMGSNSKYHIDTYGLSVWNDRIYFCDTDQIFSLPLTGGEPTVVYTLDTAGQEKLLYSVMVSNETILYSTVDKDWNQEITSILLPEHTHSYQSVVKNPTCTEEGYTRYTCSGCLDSYTQDTLAPLGHTYSDQVIAPDCATEGCTVHTCSRCSDSYTDNIVAALGHSFTDYRSDQNATCSENGTMTRVCTVCNLVDTVIEENSATGHDMDSGKVTVEPQPGVPGLWTYTCNNCGMTVSFPMDYTPDDSCSHETITLVDYTAPTCSSRGYSGNWICTLCNAILGGGEMIEALPHTEIIDPAIAPTCTQRGKGEGRHCEVCQITTIPQESIPPLGHSFGPWYETVAPTTTSMGEERCRCETCGVELTRNTDALTNPFSDVAPGAYYEIPVLWAVEQGITNGISPTSFGPDQKCTRNQVVTFLWRSAGEPEPQSRNNPFVDVAEEDYYYKAVLWAVEQGITNGVDATHFGSAQECTRAQVATFLWRAMGKPDPKSASNSFSDVSAGEYYYNAVLWAVENGITNGMGDGRFAPNDTCTRGQIVTFLYRALN